MQRLDWHDLKCEGSLILAVGTFNLGRRLWMLAGERRGNEAAQVHEEECIVIAIEKLHRENSLMLVKGSICILVRLSAPHLLRHSFC